MMPRWSRASIRVRLTGWYTVVLCLMLVVYASATFVAVRHEFVEQFDEQLHDDFETAEGFLKPTADGRIVWAGEEYSMQAGKMVPTPPKNSAEAGSLEPR